MRYAIAIVAGIAMIVAFLKWSEKRDVKVQEASDQYEICVQIEYGTTPGAIWLETGEYPECDFENVSAEDYQQYQEYGFIN